MSDKENLFRNFPETTEKDWIEKVEKDLKGRAFEELFWAINDDIKIAPFYYANKGLLSVPNNKQTTNAWEIGEDVFVKDPKVANRQLLTALESGINAPRLVVQGSLDQTQIATLFEQVKLSYISIHFLFKNTNAALSSLKAFFNYLRENNIDPSEIKGSINHKDDDLLDELNKFATIKLPNFKVCTIAVEDSDPSEISKSLAQAVAKGSQYLAILNEKGIPPETTNKHLQFSISVGRSYFIEIAKIRALKILWANILEAFGVENAIIPDIEAHLSPSAFDGHANTNMIRATSQAMSAVLGGINRLTVLPSDATITESTDFSRRIARNVQHLLTMESFLDRVIDPAKGSYYIEKLTEKIAEAAWADFQKMEAKK